MCVVASLTNDDNTRPLKAMAPPSPLQHAVCTEERNLFNNELAPHRPVQGRTKSLYPNLSSLLAGLHCLSLKILNISPSPPPLINSTLLYILNLPRRDNYTYTDGISKKYTHYIQTNICV